MHYNNIAVVTYFIFYKIYVYLYIIIMPMRDLKKIIYANEGLQGGVLAR